jgi:hypothetical protein
MQNCLWKLKLCGRYTLSEMELLPNTPNFTGRADIISELKKYEIPKLSNVRKWVNRDKAKWISREEA